MKDHSEFYKQVGAKIHARRGKTLSQDALASAVGLTRSSISNIEKGRQKLLLHTLIDISEALHVEPANLLPDRPSEVKVDDSQLAQLPEAERVFIQSAIGLNPIQKGNNGREEKKDTGSGSSASTGSQDLPGTSPRVGNRASKGRKDRR